MTWTIQPGGMLQSGEPRYEGLKAEFASPEFAAYLNGMLPAGHRFRLIHPLANLLPMLPEPERATFRASLGTRQNHAVIFHRGLLLDGRNRARELIALGKPINFVTLDGTDADALAFVKAENIERRHLNESQRADFAARVAQLKVGANQHTIKPAPIGAPSLAFASPGGAAPDGSAAIVSQGEAPAPIITQDQAAEMFNVSRRSVQRAAVVLDKGAPELQAAVQQGKVAVSTAAEVAELPIDEQKKIVAAADQKVVKEVAKKARDEANKKRRDERVEKWRKQAEGNSPLSTAMKFQIIYFDPATKFAAGDSDRSTENHYQTMKEDDIASLPIGELATPDAILLMWTTVPWLRKSIRLIEGWGFEYKSCAVWDKEDIGLGFWWQNQHEILLAATRGSPVAPENGSILGRSLYREKRGPHSAKPLYFRDRIDGVPEWRGLNKVELFARVDGPMPEGWFAWGNEARVPAQQSLAMEAAE